jgi:hypothetical protein
VIVELITWSLFISRNRSFQCSISTTILPPLASDPRTSNGNGVCSCEVHVMLEPSCEGFWQPEWRTLLRQQGFPSPPRHHHCCHRSPMLMLPPRLPPSLASDPHRHRCHCYRPPQHSTAAPPLIEGCGQDIGESHCVYCLSAFPWPSSRGYMNMVAAYFTHTHCLVCHQHLPVGMRTWRRSISPTPAASFVTNTFLWLREHGGRVFHPHLLPRLSPTPSCGYTYMVAVYFTHTCHLVCYQHLPAATHT